MWLEERVIRDPFISQFDTWTRNFYGEDTSDALRDLYLSQSQLTFDQVGELIELLQMCHKSGCRCKSLTKWITYATNGIDKNKIKLMYIYLSFLHRFSGPIHIKEWTNCFHPRLKDSWYASHTKTFICNGCKLVKPGYVTTCGHMWCYACAPPVAAVGDFNEETKKEHTHCNKCNKKVYLISIYFE